MFRRRSILADESGASLVETALVFPMFLAMLLGILQVGVLGFMTANFDDALASASRKIRTGQADGPTDAPSFVSAICDGMITVDCASRLTVVVQAASDASTVVKAKTPANPNNQFSKGAPRDYVLVTAQYRWPLVIPFVDGAFPHDSKGDVLLTNKLLFRNEPYA